MRERPSEHARGSPDFDSLRTRTAFGLKGRRTCSSNLPFANRPASEITLVRERAEQHKWALWRRAWHRCGCADGVTDRFQLSAEPIAFTSAAAPCRRYEGMCLAIALIHIPNIGNHKLVVTVLGGNIVIAGNTSSSQLQATEDRVTQ